MKNSAANQGEIDEIHLGGVTVSIGATKIQKRSALYTATSFSEQSRNFSFIYLIFLAKLHRRHFLFK
jgi:hypothetical protein